MSDLLPHKTVEIQVCVVYDVSRGITGPAEVRLRWIHRGVVESDPILEATAVALTQYLRNASTLLRYLKDEHPAQVGVNSRVANDVDVVRESGGEDQESSREVAF